MVIKCKLGCKVVDCKTCETLRQNSKFQQEMIISEIKKMNLAENTSIFELMRSAKIICLNNEAIINYLKDVLKERGVTIPEEAISD